MAASNNYDITQSLGIGDSVKITEREFAVGIETYWKDLFIFLLNKDGKIISDDHLLFYNSKLRVGEDLSDYNGEERNYHAISPDKAVIGPFENEAHSAYPSYELRRSHVNLNNLDPNVERIVFCLSAYNTEIEAMETEYIHARLYTDADWLWGKDKGSTIALAEFPIWDNNTDPHMAEEVISLDKTIDGWLMRVLGIHHPTIESILKKYIPL